MKVVITNTAALNTGDAAILVATINILRRAFPGALDIAVYDQQAEVSAQYYPALIFHPVLFEQIRQGSSPRARKVNMVRTLAAALLWRSPLRSMAMRLAPRSVRAGLDEFARSEFVLSAGGTYLVPHYRIFPKLCDLLIALALGRPVVLFTQSLGPFPKSRKNLLHFVLRRARIILVRDALSYRHLLDFGIRAERIAECADAAFALSGMSGSTASMNRNRSNVRVAISIRDWPHFGTDPQRGMDRYFDAVAAMARWLIEHHNAEIVFLSTCQGIPEYWTDDSKSAENVVSRLPAKLRSQARICRAFHTPEALIDRLKTFDLVVATRMHVAILALGAGIPVLPIAYEFKTVELFNRLGFGDLVRKIDTVTGQDLCAAVEGILAKRFAIQATLGSAIERERDSAFRAGRLIREAIGLTS